MRNLPFDSRWLIVLFLVLLLINPGGLTGVVLLAVGAGWALQTALGMLRIGGGRSSGGTKVTYWRGQRIETRQTPSQRARSLPVTQIAIAVFYLLLGIGMAYAAIVIFLRLSGIV